MWLDAFKSRDGNMPEAGVPSVPDVPPTCQPNGPAGLDVSPRRNAENNQDVPGVPTIKSGTPGTHWNAFINPTSSTEVLTPKPSIHRGLAIFGTPGTCGTPQKKYEPETQVETSDAVREFMEVDGMTQTEAVAMAAKSVPTLPPGEWSSLIAELDVLIEQYGSAAGLTGEAVALIFSRRYAQSLASIPESLEWFRREVGLIPDFKPP